MPALFAVIPLLHPNPNRFRQQERFAFVRFATLNPHLPSVRSSVRIYRRLQVVSLLLERRHRFCGVREPGDATAKHEDLDA
jgi:hypothetical protein